MVKRVSPRLDGHPLALGAVLGLRWVGRTTLGERLGGRFYRRKSSAVAAELAGLVGVESVYLSGSARQRVHLGYSDIDLVLATKLRSADEELRLRHELVRILRRANRPIELFLHVDYVEATDLELLRRLGNAWSLELDRRSELLSGRDHRRLHERATPRHARVAALGGSLGHWINQSCLLVEKPSLRDAFAVWRIAERLLRGVLAAWLGRAPDEPLERLLELAAPKLSRSAAGRLAFEPPTEARRDAAIRDLSTVTLEALDRHAREFAGELDGEWPEVVKAPPPIDWPLSRDLERAVGQHGFDGAEAVPRGVGGAKHVLFVTAPEGMPLGDAIERHTALVRQMAPLPGALFGKATLPVLLTPALRRAGALIEPFPLVGAALGPRAAWASSSSLPPLPAPGPAVWKILSTSAEVQLLWRPRGRALRLARGRTDTLEGMAREILGAVPQLLSASAGGPIDLSELRLGPGDLEERFLLERLRELQERVRPGLRSLLTAAESG